VRRILAWAVLPAILAAVGDLRAQAPIIGEINFYGLHKIAPDRILSALKVHPGDRLPASKGDMEDRIEEISGIVLSNVQVICCDGPRVTLFIGIEERGAPHAGFREDPSGAGTLPPDLTDAYNWFAEALSRAAAGGRAGEDLSAGHSVMDDPETSALQRRFLELVPTAIPELRDVLRESADAGQRAAAATLIGYAPNKAEVIDDLQYALQDPSASVRANALRSLTAIAILASQQPKLEIHIAPTWLVELLHSVVLSDRVEAVQGLLALTEGSSADPVLDLIRERSLASLIEMARWKTPSYALPPFVLAGRLAGVSYVDTLQQWASGDREPLLAKAAGAGVPRKKSGGAVQ
jgi:hypothetical protein